MQTLRTIPSNRRSKNHQLCKNVMLNVVVVNSLIFLICMRNNIRKKRHSAQVSNSQVNHTKVTECGAFCEGTSQKATSVTSYQVSPRQSPLIRVLDKKPTNRPNADWPIRSLANAHRTNLGEEHFMSGLWSCFFVKLSRTGFWIQPSTSDSVYII